MIAFGFSFIAGLLTSLSPCVLPVLPIIVGGALRENRWAPVAMASGMIAAFVVVGWSLAAFGGLGGMDSGTVRSFSALLLGIFGLVLLNQSLQDGVSKLFLPIARFSERAMNSPKLTGLGGQFAIGILLGALWSPCSGPTLGTAITLAAQEGGTAKSLAILLFFGIGAVLPMLLLAYGAQSIFKKNREKIFRGATAAKKTLGSILVLMSGLMLSGLDKVIEGHLLSILPNWMIDLSTRF